MSKKLSWEFRLEDTQKSGSHFEVRKHLLQHIALFGAASSI